MKLKRILAALLCSAVIASSAACSSDSGSSSSTSSTAGESSSASEEGGENSETPAASDLEEVTLSMVLISDQPTDFNVVYDEVNAKLKEDINATFDVQFLSWADWNTNYPLILASDTDLDLINSANWSQYFKYAREGAFTEITEEMLQTYAPTIYANTPEEVLAPAYVDGKLYNIPMDYKEITIDGYIVRGDVMAELGMTEITSLEEFGEYLYGAKELYPEIIPWNSSDRAGYIFRSDVIEGNGYIGKDGVFSAPITMKVEDNPTVMSYLDLPEVYEFYEKMNEFYMNDLIPKSVLVNEINERDSFVNGNSMAFVDNIMQAAATYTQLNTSNPEWDVKFFPITEEPQVANPYINNGMAISFNSDAPERALMALDLLKTDEWYNQTTTYGIQGTHWDLDDNGNLLSLEASINFAPDSACPWGWRNTEFYLTPAASFSNYNDVMSQAQEAAFNTNIASYTTDKTVGSITSIEAAMQTVFDQYLMPLQNGVTEDLDADLAKAKEQFEIAGMEELIGEYQTQIDAFGVTVE